MHFYIYVSCTPFISFFGSRIPSISHAIAFSAGIFIYMFSVLGSGPTSDTLSELKMKRAPFLEKKNSKDGPWNIHGHPLWIRYTCPYYIYIYIQHMSCDHV